jgi:hypothetical protein
MERAFKFQSNEYTTEGFCNDIEVTVNVESENGTDYTHDIVYIYDETVGVERLLASFSKKEQQKMERMAEQVANEAANDAYQSLMEYKADIMLDIMKGD